MRYKTRSEAALYVWDYFFLSNVPAPNDQAAWASIERATGRIREAESHLDPDTPPDVRAHHARRLRNAARVALRQIERLSTRPAPWVIEHLVQFEALGDELIQTLADRAEDVVVH